MTDDSAVDITTDTAIGGTGVDSVTISAGQTLTVTTAIVFGEGVDTLTLANGAILTGGDVDLGVGDDIVTLGTGAQVTSNILGGEDADSVTLGAGANVGGNVDGGAGTDLVTLGDNATVSGQVVGGTEIDTLSFAGYTTARSIVLTGVADGFTGEEASLNSGGAGGFTGIDEVIGSGASTDVLTGLTTSNAVWTLDTANVYEEQGTSQELTFSAVETLAGGGAVDDTFRFEAGVSESFTLTGNGGTNVVDGSQGIDAFVIDAANSGTVTVSGQTSSFTSVGTLNGRDGADSFAVAVAGSLTGAIDGGLGADTLTGPSTGAVFTVTGADRGDLQDPGATSLLNTIGGAAQGFTNVENLSGAAGQDVFDVTAAGASLAGGISGGGEVDTITIGGNANVVAGVVDGGGDADVINLNDGADVTGGGVDGGAGTDAVNVTGTVSGDLGGGADDDIFTLAAGAILNGVITGGTGSDLIDGGDTSTVFRITGLNSGLLDGRVDGFSSVESLAGGTADDTFRFEGAGALSGAIDGGGAGADSDVIEGLDGVVDNVTLTGADAGDADFAADGFSDVESVDLRDGADNVTLGDGSSLSGTLSGGAGADSLIGPDTATTFNVTGVDAGNVTGGSTIPDFQSFENLTGGADNDTFNVDANLSDNIDGGAGTEDTLNLAAGVTIGGNVTNVENVNLVVNGTTGTTGGADTIVIRNTGGILEAVVNGSVSQFFTPAGASNISLTVAGLGGVDTLTVNYSVGTLPSEITFVDTQATPVDGQAEQVRLVGDGIGGNQLVSFDPVLDADGLRVVTLRNGAGTLLNTLRVEPAALYELEAFSSASVVSAGTADVVTVSRLATSAISSQVALQIRETTGAGNFEEIQLIDVASVTVDLGTNDAAFTGSADSVTVNDGALRSYAGLTGVNISTGGGVDTLVLNESSYLNTVDANVLTIDLGDGVDEVQATAAGDLSLSNTGLSLDDGVATGNVTLTNFTTAGRGEDATLTGTGGAESFDVSGHNGAVSVDGQGGTDTLSGQNALDATWTFADADTGVAVDASNPAGTVTFDLIEEFIGGTGNDTFVLGAGVLTPIVSLDGSVGVNTLDITGSRRRSECDTQRRRWRCGLCGRRDGPADGVRQHY